MPQEELNNIGREIIKNNTYLTLATCDKEPWAAPLYYCFDDKFNFYFISQMNSLHTQHILKNHNAAFAIFDSNSAEGEGNGIQGSGKAYLLNDEEVLEALKWYKTTFIDLKPENLRGDAPYRLFKLVPERFYILDPESKDVDKRVEIFLS